MQIPLNWLTKRTSFDEAIQDHLVNGVPFGLANEDWKRLASKLADGDELWYFEPQSRSDIQLWGLALLRGDQVICTVITGVH